MKFHQKTLFLFFSVLLSLPINAQDYNGFIEGYLIDSQSKDPVVFATIRIKGFALGVISNQDGGFKIPADLKFKSDTLVISSMGYETKEVNFSTLKEGFNNQIFLKSSVIELSETVVTAKQRERLGRVKKELTAEQIIKNAIERIPDNYDKNPFQLVGYYRDYQLREQKYINLNEALIKVFDEGFEVEDHTSLKFGLYSYNSNLDFEVDSFAAKPYDYRIRDKFIPDAAFRHIKIPNELTLLFNHDAIRNNKERTYSYVNTLVEDFIKGHDFFTYFLTNYGNQKVYKIKFEKSIVPFKVKGDIYIDKDTYAIRKLDYAVYRQKLTETSPTNYNESEMDLLYEILVEYQNHKEHMYLNYISFHNQFKLIRPPKFFIKEAIFNPNTYKLTMVLNKPARNWLKLNPRDFTVYYKKYRLRVKKVVRVGYVGDTYVLSFPRKGKLQRKRLGLLTSKIEDQEKPSFKISVLKMIDGDGNFLAERKSELLNQFREFFTQKVISVDNMEVDNALYVDKSVPLGHNEQLKTKVKIGEKYWMNTPLRKVKQ